jgi:pantoate--beta-alanine ligase
VALQKITRGEEMRAAVRAAQQAGRTVGLAPTMGALHEGHLTIVDAARRECDCVVASIFVNPSQFAPGEDFERYPRPLDRDLELLDQRRCDYVFVPDANEMYPPGFDSWVDVGRVAQPLEGAARPGHFRGVATVVLKLFQLVPADRAYFGQKDYQQTLVVQRMVADLNLPIVLRLCTTVREADGLAMSSRNAYLNPDQRQRATSLFGALQLAASAVGLGETRAAILRELMRNHMSNAGVDVEYIAFLRDGTMDEVETIDGPTVVAIAARVGKTRLIDNYKIG